MIDFTYISYSFVPSRTANSLHVMKMCSALSGLGVNVQLFVPDVKDSTSEVDIFEFYDLKYKFDIHYIKCNGMHKLKRLTFVLNVLLKLITLKSSLVYSRDLYCAYISSFKYNTYYEVHSPITGKVKLFIFNRMLNSSKFINLISITNNLKSYFIDNLLVSEKIISVLPDGADDAKIESSIYKDNDVLKVGYVGHLYQGKGMEIVNSIHKSLSSDVEIHIIGGLDKDVEYWSKKIKSKNVIFHGFIPQCNLHTYINALDVCLLPNQKLVLPNGTLDLNQNISNYTSPLKMFEYMSYGKPIIASDIPVLKEVLNENNSILVAPDKPQDWVKAINFLKEPKNRDRLGKQALLDFENNYSWKSRAKKLLDNININ